MSESTIRAAVDRAVAQALAGAGTPRGGPARLDNLDQLNGLPCNVGTPNAGVVRIGYGQPQAGSGISMICLTGATVTSPQPPPTTAAPPPITTTMAPPPTFTAPQPTEPPIQIPFPDPPPPAQPVLPDPVAPPEPDDFPPAPADGAS